MILMNEIQDKLSKKLFLNKYTSDYSDDLKEAISLMPTPLINAFEGLRGAKSLCGLDCNKSYGYFLSKIKYFGQFTLFDTWEIYSNEEIENLKIEKLSTSDFPINNNNLKNIAQACMLFYQNKKAN